MKIIVMCANASQFYNYVDAVLHEESKLTKRTVVNHGSTITVDIEKLEFIYCRNPDTLRGRSFGKSDRIVRVGTWYDIPEDIQEDIVTSFMARIKK